jgi:hypothetical protein
MYMTTLWFKDKDSAAPERPNRTIYQQSSAQPGQRLQDLGRLTAVSQQPLWFLTFGKMNGALLIGW